MTAPDIPEDIRLAAELLTDRIRSEAFIDDEDGGAFSDWRCEDIVAAALLSERTRATEAAAQIVDAEAADQEEAPNDEWHVKTARYLRRIAASIRTEGTAK